MKAIFTRILVGCTLLTLIFGAAGVMPVRAVGQRKPPLVQYLNPDGTLNLSSGYTGNVDISNYSISIDPARGPVFRPQMALGAWSALGATPLNDYVYAIAISGTDVYVGGQFTDVGGDPNADYIAKWDALTGNWSALGTTPLNNSVYSLAVSSTDVYVGGLFSNAGGESNADFIAKWDGADWSALGATPLNFWVLAIAISGTDIYAGGAFTDAGGDPNADSIAKWDSLTGNWSALGTPSLDGDVYAVGISGTDVYVGGGFTTAGGNSNADGIVKWDGVNWSALGATPLNSTVRAIAISGTDVYVGGWFTNAGGDPNADYIAKWNGTSWSALGTTPLTVVFGVGVEAIGISGTDVYIGGSFSNAGGDPNADRTAKWDGVSWSALGATPLNEGVNAIGIRGTDVYVGGYFTNAGGDPNADHIARFDTSPVPTATPTVTTTEPPTETMTASVTPTPTVTATPPATQTKIATATSTKTATRTKTKTATRTKTKTATHTKTKTATRTKTKTATHTKTKTATVTKTRTKTLTPTKTPAIVKLYSIGAQDGWVLETHETSEIGGTIENAITVTNLGDLTTKQQFRSILSFNTSSLPDTASLTAITLKIKKATAFGNVDPVVALQGFLIDIKTGFFGSFPALESSDFQAAVNKTLGPASPAVANDGFYNFNLINGKDYINKLASNNGLTQIRLRFKLDDNNDALVNYLLLYSGNETVITNRPQLVIRYTVP